MLNKLRQVDDAEGMEALSENEHGIAKSLKLAAYEAAYHCTPGRHALSKIPTL